MTEDQAMDILKAVLHEVAPEAELSDIAPDEALQEAFDLDSIDFLNFAVGLHERTGLEIPERDYPQLGTVRGCVHYLTSMAA